MTIADIIELGSNLAEDATLDQFIADFKNNTKQIIFLVEKEDGSVAVGSNVTNRKDLVWDLYKLQEIIKMIISGQE